MKAGLPLALALVVGLLLAVVLWLAQGAGIHWSAPKPVEPAAVEVVTLPAAVQARADALAATRDLVEAPLFWPSRRPPPPPEAEPEPEPEPEPPREDPLKDVALLGTFVSHGQGGVMLAVEPDQKKARGKAQGEAAAEQGGREIVRLTVGETYQGLTLRQVSPLAVEFEDEGGELHYLSLEIELPNLQQGPPP